MTNDQDKKYDLQTFESDMFGTIRTAVEVTTNKVLFRALDIAKSLNYAAPAKAICDLCKGVTVLVTPSAGGPQRTKYITEPDVYRLVMRSKRPDAEAFQDWIFEVVIPSIRKTGGYIHTTPDMSNDEIMARGYMVAMETIEQKEKQLAEAQQTIEEQKPMVQFAEAITASQAAILIGDLAKLITQNGYKIGRTTLFKWLRDHGFLFKNETRPYQIWVEKGLFEISETLVQTHHGSKIKITTKVTPKGQRYFLDIFKKLV